MSTLNLPAPPPGMFWRIRDEKIYLIEQVERKNWLGFRRTVEVCHGKRTFTRNMHAVNIPPVARDLLDQYFLDQSRRDAYGDYK